EERLDSLWLSTSQTGCVDIPKAPAPQCLARGRAFRRERRLHTARTNRDQPESAHIPMHGYTKPPRRAASAIRYQFHSRERELQDNCRRSACIRPSRSFPGRALSGDRGRYHLKAVQLRVERSPAIARI